MSSTLNRDLFKSTAWYYSRYRGKYPQQLFDLIVERFELDGTERLLDLASTVEAIMAWEDACPYAEMARGTYAPLAPRISLRWKCQMASPPRTTT